MREYSSSSSKKAAKNSKKIMKLKQGHNVTKSNSKTIPIPKQKATKPQTSKAKSKETDNKVPKAAEILHEADDYNSIPLLPEAHLSEAEFNDPLTAIISLKNQYEEYGAIKICPPSGWKPSFSFSVSDKAVTTRKQVLQDLTKGKAFDQKVDEYKKGNFEAFANKFQQNYEYQRATSFTNAYLSNELEFWHLVDNPSTTKKVEVEYAADLSSMKFGSGFPENSEIPSKTSSDHHPFNLNHLSDAPNSLFQILKKKQDKISGISSPWMYMGMLFASFCWHVEDCYMYSANYMHKGQAKTWYIVPGKYKEQVEKLLRNTYARLFEKKPNILNQIILQLNPLELVKAGIPVYKTHQKPREFVITFPKAFHAGFSHGFNVSEAVNFVTIDWLKSMKEAQMDYEKNNYNKKLVFPPEWLICENYWQRDQLKFEKHIIDQIKENFKKEMENELEIRKNFWEKINSLKIKVSVERMKKEHYDKTMCFFCKNYSFLSYLKCDLCKRKICLKHCEKKCCQQRKLTLFCKLSDSELKSASKE